MELQSLMPARHRADTPVLAVSADPMERINKMIPIVTDRTGGRFLVTLLSDADMKVIDRYGLRNEEAAKQGMKVPHPTTYVIDKSGRIRWKFTEQNYVVRPTNEVILAELQKVW